MQHLQVQQEEEWMTKKAVPLFLSSKGELEDLEIDACVDAYAEVGRLYSTPDEQEESQRYLMISSHSSTMLHFLALLSGRACG